MCGIAGIVGIGRAIDPLLLAAMTDAIRHRGPDDVGTFIAHDQALAVGLGSRRLSILDISPAGHMPMESLAGDTVLAYNGEIYNHRELRRALEASGARYRSNTDTETLLHAYEARGSACFAELNGMFAAAIYDRRRQRVVLARDRMGIKPLYYAWRDGMLLFASELKALLCYGGLERQVDQVALDLYLSLGYVPAPHCLIRGVSKLGAGQALIIDADGSRIEEFWPSSAVDESLALASDGELAGLVRASLEESIHDQLMSDVPLGVLLSGGIDSTLITAVAQRAVGQPLDTFAIGFASEGLDPAIAAAYNADLHYAALAAQRIGTRHHELVVGADTDVGGLLADLCQQMDEPVWEASFLAIYLLCRLARDHGVKVVLTGDGSDELFAGYHWYRAAQQLLRYERVPLLGYALPLLSLLFGKRELGVKARDLRQKLSATSLGRYRAIYNQFSDAEKLRLLGSRPADDPVDRLVRPLLERAGGSLLDQLAYADLRLWVGEHFNQRLDRMSMACSVEARVPFQDNRVVDLALRIPASRKLGGGDPKPLLRQAFGDLIPAEILRRPKRPFATPQHAWLRGRLRPFAQEVLTEDRLQLTNVLDPREVRMVVDGYVSGRELYSQKLSIILMFQLWSEAVIGRRPVVYG